MWEKDSRRALLRLDDEKSSEAKGTEEDRKKEVRDLFTFNGLVADATKQNNPRTYSTDSIGSDGKPGKPTSDFGQF